MKRFTVNLLVFYGLQLPCIGSGQKVSIDSLSRLEYNLEQNNKYDSAIAVCRYALAADAKEAKESRMDCKLIECYFAAGKYAEAKRAGKKYIHKLDAPVFIMNRNGLEQREFKRFICWDFYVMCNEAEDYKHALKYLRKIEKKYLYFFCGNSKPGYLNKLYSAMIDCYLKLGDVADAEKYQNRLYKDYE